MSLNVIRIWYTIRVERRQSKVDAAFDFRRIYIAPFPRSTAPLRAGHCASEVLGATKLAEVWLSYPRRMRVDASQSQQIPNFLRCAFNLPLEFLYVGQPKAVSPDVGLLAKAAQAFMK